MLSQRTSVSLNLFPSSGELKIRTHVGRFLAGKFSWGLYRVFDLCSRNVDEFELVKTLY
jgi:hypothetical protein